jgi:hypothetical protein
MDDARAQKFQSPVAGIICVAQLNVFLQDFVDVGSQVPRKGEFLEICDGSGIVNVHYFVKKTKY